MFESVAQRVEHTLMGRKCPRSLRVARSRFPNASEMMTPSDAERVTGCKVGGISPFGQRRRVPTIMEEQALLHDYVLINAGQRGLQVRLDPRDARDLLGAKATALMA